MESKSLYKNLLNAKKEIGKISKDSSNPFFKSKYFDVNTLLEHVEPILQKNGLLLLQPIEAEWLKTKIIDVESGEVITSEIHLQNFPNPQNLGSAITYYRRYTLQSLLGLQAEDDDANKASVSTTKSPTDSTEDKKWLNVGDKAWTVALERKLPITEVRKHYKVNKANAEQYERELNKLKVA